ncbi:MAG: ADP-forming succinate--CoA ligase subunit beta [Bdellovibrionaceae bacterium]|jgi:succinyl-CoA synthetase beta subunit|nr:ADP-forming succinate--CoA ligase subunit beta [Pseudobdellovibrionaceae bacterium]
MNIHEYQAKEVLRRFGGVTLEGGVTENASEAKSIAEKIGGKLWVVKAQIHAGGRGKGGGVKIAKSLDEVEKLTGEILGMNLVTHQTGPEGKTVNKVFIESGCDIAKEYYVAALLDRATSRITMMASSEGGMDIEEVAEKTPELIHSVDIDPTVGLAPYQARQLAFKIGMKGKVVNKAVKQFITLYNALMDTDCALAEINPLVETSDGDVVILDAKMNFDSNALYRQPTILEYRDVTEEDPAEYEASKFDLAFIKLDGNIGCLVNGAGLAMSTMDVIKIHGGSPANFLDVGGGATKEKVTEAFKIILQDPNVKGILVNIFGGIMKCDIIAEGVIAATKDLGLEVPLVVRLQGTNVDAGKKLLADSGLNILPADDLTDAAEKIVGAVKGA